MRYRNRETEVPVSTLRVARRSLRGTGVLSGDGVQFRVRRCCTPMIRERGGPGAVWGYRGNVYEMKISHFSLNCDSENARELMSGHIMSITFDIMLMR